MKWTLAFFSQAMALTKPLDIQVRTNNQPVAFTATKVSGLSVETEDRFNDIVGPKGRWQSLAHTHFLDGPDSWSLIGPFPTNMQPPATPTEYDFYPDRAV